MDDEVYIREIFSAMLSSMGYKVKLAKNSEEALVIVKELLVLKLSIDAVILDLTIPGGIGGKDTLIKMLKLDPDIKAIASSGYSTDPVMAIPKDFGFKAKLQKPFSRIDVENVLVNVLSLGK
jgi:CheY-like chemotaxis protein